MRAVKILRYGGPEGLEIGEVSAPPAPVADRVLVRVRAAALNRADLLQRMGRYPAPPGCPQETPGLELAGEIEATGPEVRRWKRGQRVFGIVGGGAQAEYVITPEDHLAEIPKNLDWAEAAAIPEAFITAHDALFTQAKLQPGETVLVHAAGSGVGTAAVQLCRAAGATVFGTARTADKLARAKPYGLTYSVVVADDKDLFVKEVLEWTTGNGVNLILDLVGGAYLPANLKALSYLGRMVLVGTTSGSQAMFDLGTAMAKRLTIKGTVLRSRPAEEKATVTRLFAAHVVPLLANGTVRPVIDSIYSLEEVREAHRRLEANESFGKIVLMMD